LNAGWINPLASFYKPDIANRTASGIFHFHPVYSIPFSYIQSKHEIMESYWCTKKNSIVHWINNGEDFDPALSPCCKTECDRWDDGWCIHIRKVGKLDRPQVFSR
jgi:hypothetical protein